MDFRNSIKRLMNVLRIRPMVGGLEISDSIVRFALWNGKTWKTAALKLPPNLIQAGQIKDHAQFVEALRQLHDQIVPGHAKKFVNVVVSLSSVNVYSQVFSLPIIEGENLDKAIQLNIQMVSPAESSQTYSGWQLLGEDQKSVRLEILSSFINRQVVDEILKSLAEARFAVHSVESRALSLTRLVREMQSGFDPSQAYLALSLDSSGLEFLVIRRGQLYFHYFNSWQDLYGAEKQVSKAAFEAAVNRSLHQVMNFYNSHWSEPLAGIFISSTALRDDLIRVIRENFQLNILELQLSLPPEISADWFVCFGSGLRAASSQREDQEISLLGISARDEFLRSQLLSFLNFWSVLIPVSLSILLAVVLGTNIFLARSEAALKESTFGTGDQVAEIKQLQTRVDSFNKLLRYISGSEVRTSRSLLLPILQSVAAAHNVKILHVSYGSSKLAVRLEGKAATEADLKAFTDDLKKTIKIQDNTFDMPLNQIRKDQDGFWFPATFTWIPSSAP